MGHNIFAWPPGTKALKKDRAVELRLNERRGRKTELYNVLGAPPYFNQKVSGSGDLMVIPVHNIVAITKHESKWNKLSKYEREWIEAILAKCSYASDTVTIQFE